MFSDLQNPKEKIDFSIAIAVILFAGIFITYFSFQQADDFNPFGIEIDNTEVEKLKIDHLEYIAQRTKDAEVMPISNRRERRNSDFAYVLPIIRKDSSTIKEEVIPSTKNEGARKTDINALLSIKKDNEKEKVISDVNINTNQIKAEVATKTEEAISDKIPSEKITEIKTKTEIQTRPEKNISSNNNSIEKECVILIMAFRQTKNKAKLLERLKEQGYKTFQSPFQGLERIGIYETCEKSQLNKTLKEVRSRFAKDALILKRK